MKKFRVRLAFLFVVVIGLSVLASGLYSARMMKDSHLDALRENMLREIRIILATVEWKKGGSEGQLIDYFNNKARYLKKSADARVTFIAGDGRVLGDSDHNPVQMDNHLGRKEIVEAQKTGAGTSIRYSDTVKRNMLYVAVPVGSANNPDGYLRLSMSLEDVETEAHKLWSGLIMGLLVLFIIAGLLSYRIAHRLTRPLENISEVAKQFTHMNYESRVEVNSQDEIGQLGQAINKMADGLQQQMYLIQEDERRLTSVLDTMISGVVMIDKEEKVVLMNRPAEEILGCSSKELLGRKYNETKLQTELTQSIEQCIEKRQHVRDEIVFYFPEERTLEINLVPMLHMDDEWSGIVIVLHDITAIRRLERMRSEFVANVSHELKTPIASVKGFAETLLAGAVNDQETAKSFLQIIYDESDRLNRLIGDILELSKIESKQAPLHFSPVDMHGFVHKTVEMMQTEAVKKDIRLETHVTEGMYIEADEDRLRQILINLLSNSINYTLEGGQVMVKVEPVLLSGDRDYEQVRITIKDTGIGIPKKDLSRIFERFYRVDKARSRISGGTGLGLSIVKHLVELHKGTIRVESVVTMGTSFIIELPVIQ